MKKEIYSFFLTISTTLAFAQVGINTTDPTETLDVNGTVRIRETTESPEDTFLLTTNDNGVIKKTSTSYAPIRIEEYAITIASGESHTFTTQNNFVESTVIVFSKNDCTRKMISAFNSFSNSFLFINGIARDKQAVPEALISDTSYSIKWYIKFPNTTGCGESSTLGGPTQFDFSFEKNTENQYTIINNGDVTRTYNFSFMRL